jgi:hypothetical protein
MTGTQYDTLISFPAATRILSDFGMDFSVETLPLASILLKFKKHATKA